MPRNLNTDKDAVRQAVKAAVEKLTDEPRLGSSSHGIWAVDPIEWRQRNATDWGHLTDEFGLAIGQKVGRSPRADALIVQMCPSCDGFRLSTFKARVVIDGLPVVQRSAELYRCERGHEFLSPTEPAPSTPAPPTPGA